MYISKIEIDNFRNFAPALKVGKIQKGTIIEFTEGTNVIIGHNNPAGARL